MDDVLGGIQVVYQAHGVEAKRPVMLFEYLLESRAGLFVVLHTFHVPALVIRKVRINENKNKIASGTYSCFFS